MKQYLLTFLFFITFISVDVIAQSTEKLNNRIMIEGTFINNLGNFSDTWSNAAGGYISYCMPVTENYQLFFRSGYLKNKLKNEITANDGSSIIIPIEIGAKYYFYHAQLMPFVQFVNGLNLIFEDINLRREKEENTRVKYAWQIGAGLTYILTDMFELDISANYQSNFYETEAMNTGFEFTLGVGIVFN